MEVKANLFSDVGAKSSETLFSPAHPSTTQHSSHPLHLTDKITKGKM